MTDAVREFLDRVAPTYGDDLLNLVAIDPETGDVTGKFFEAGDRDAQVRFVASRAQSNLYFGVNSAKVRTQTGRWRKGQIEHVLAFAADFDPKSPQTRDEDVGRAVHAIKECPLPPTIVIDTGRGLQAHWQVNAPVHVNGNLADLEAVGQRITEYFKSLGIPCDAVHSLDHLFRLPGTTNWMSKTKRANGFVEPKPVVLKHIDTAARYGVEDFARFGRTAAPIDYSCVDCGPDRSADLFRRVCDDMRDGIADDIIAQRHSQHPKVVEQRRPEEYLLRTMRKARAHVARDVPASAELAQPTIPPRAPMQWDDLSVREPPAREWIIDRWIPKGHPLLLVGRGGIGKTLLAQNLATSVVLGQQYIGPVPAPLRVLVWAGEDDHDELWRRQVRICEHFDAPIASLSDRLIVHSYAGADITLCAPIFGRLVPTAMLEELREQVHDYAVDLVFIDNVARVFGGNENDRHAVTSFISWVHGACAPAAVVLIAHPAKAAGSEYSGSTAWEGAVRSRLYLSDEQPGTTPKRELDDNERGDSTDRWLSTRKANYTDLGSLKFSLINGVLAPVGTGALHVTTAPLSDSARADAVLSAFDMLVSRGEQPVAGSGSPSYLTKLAEKHCLLGGMTRRRFDETLRELLDSKRLVSGEVGRYSNRGKRFGLMHGAKEVHK